MCTHIGYIAFQYIIIVIIKINASAPFVVVVRSPSLEIERMSLVDFILCSLYLILQQKQQPNQQRDDREAKKKKKYVCFFFSPASAHCI